MDIYVNYDFEPMVSDTQPKYSTFAGSAETRAEAREVLKRYYGRNYNLLRFTVREFLNKYFEPGKCDTIYCQLTPPDS